MIIDIFGAFFTMDLWPGRCLKFQVVFVHSCSLHQHKSSHRDNSHLDGCSNEEHAHTFGLSIDPTFRSEGQACCGNTSFPPAIPKRNRTALQNLEMMAKWQNKRRISSKNTHTHKFHDTHRLPLPCNPITCKFNTPTQCLRNQFKESLNMKWLSEPICTIK